MKRGRERENVCVCGCMREREREKGRVYDTKVSLNYSITKVMAITRNGNLFKV